MAKKVISTSDTKSQVELYSQETLDELERQYNVENPDRKEVLERLMKKNIALYHILWMFTPVILPRRPCHDFLPLKRLKCPTTQKELVSVVAAQLKAEDKAKFINRREDNLVIDVIDCKISQLTKQSINRKKELEEKEEDDNCSAEEKLMDKYEEQVWDFFNFLRVLALKLCKRRYLIREDVGRYLVNYDSFERILHRALARMDYREPTLHPLITHIKKKIKLLHLAHFFEDKEKCEALQFHKYFVKFTRRGIVLDTTDVKPDFMNWYKNERLKFQDEIDRYELALQLLERAMDKLEQLRNTLNALAAESVHEAQKKSHKK